MWQTNRQQLNKDKKINVKKFFTYPVFLVIFLSIVGSILFGSLLRHHYLGGERVKSLQNIAVIFASIYPDSKYAIETIY